MLIFTALFVIGKDQKQPKCTPIGEQINYGIITHGSPKKFLICKHETASKQKEQGRAKLYVICEGGGGGRKGRVK